MGCGLGKALAMPPSVIKSTEKQCKVPLVRLKCFCTFSSWHFLTVLTVQDKTEVKQKHPPQEQRTQKSMTCLGGNPVLPPSCSCRWHIASIFYMWLFDLRLSDMLSVHALTWQWRRFLSCNQRMLQLGGKDNYFVSIWSLWHCSQMCGCVGEHCRYQEPF